MAFRKFDTGTWQDPWFEALSKDAKLLFIYLWTNETCNAAGMYRLTKKRIYFDCGVDIDKTSEEIKEKIVWNTEETIVWVKNFFKHQRQNEKFSQSAVKAILGLPYKFKKAFCDLNKDLLEKDGISPLTIPLITETDTVTEEEADISSTPVEPHTNTIPTPNGIKKKIKFLDCVLLYETEYEKLSTKYSKEKTDKAIEILNNAIQSKGYKYKSHYHTILGWPMKEAMGGNNGNGSGTTSSAGKAFKETGSARAQSDGQPYPVDLEVSE